ncbi:O-antigen ligase family protein [Novosphingobium mangrovi (ex Huang et al. 2023)]|uniref:O-antigen ligase family protein n=1 Tax=Novosphingobium mangrovi (ex Huang et al. 2023) TaxID=2976432 RepID=A0ABT2HZU6_9SPHN|nr:O-antigen ligase family protein [Novosphingobium mangrovi (ex Huang et al. 2023)]MCT2398075.1 O-antigen ligase family protein [Novosphingobium mangrovi (ex Huang et al. 2023)]
MTRFLQSGLRFRQAGVALWRQPEFQLQALLVLALLFGGGGSAYGINNLMVQLAALLVLALHPERVMDFLRDAPRFFVVLCGLTVALPLAQLVPLPPSLWGRLPGRDLLSESLGLINRSDAWYSISLAPSRTLIAFFSLIPMFAVFVLSWRFDRSEWERVLYTLVLLGLAAMALGGVQMLGGNRVLLLYREHVHAGYLYGTFANHNSAGLFFVLAITGLLGLIGGGMARARRHGGRWFQPWVRVGVAVLLAVAVVLTQSRSSIGVLLMVIMVAAFGYLYRMDVSRTRKMTFLVLGVLVAAGALIGLQAGTRFGSSFDRFERLDDVRPAIWEDTITSAERFWPVGSGISTFPEVFEVDETLEHVWAFHAGRAHNDYLEIAQEGGVVGVILIVAWLVWIAWAGLRAWQGERRWQGVAAVSGLAVIGMQSSIDYPLRNQAILCVAASFLSLLVHAASKKDLNK